jgi:hypothetical protein
MKLKDLGLKSSKEIPAAMLPLDFEPEQAVEEVKQIEEGEIN